MYRSPGSPRVSHSSSPATTSSMSTTLIAPSTYAGIRRSRKRRTTSVDDRRSSPRPNTCAGQATTTGSPRAATRSASTSAACLASAYGTPTGPERTCRSSSAPPRRAGPIAATEDTWTTRATPAARQASSVTRVPPACTRISSSCASPRWVVPAAWKAVVTPFAALRIERRSVTSARTRSTSSPASAASGEPARTVTRTSSPRASSARTRCDPMKPVAPVTSTRDTARG